MQNPYLLESRYTSSSKKTTMDTFVKLPIHANLENKTKSMLGLPSLAHAMFSLLTMSLQQALLGTLVFTPSLSTDYSVSCCTNAGQGPVFPSVKNSDLCFINREEGKKAVFHLTFSGA